MNPSPLLTLRPFLGVLAVLLTVGTVLKAGPPLICHPFEIAGAPSLPWGQGHGWNSPAPSYDVKKLVPDTLAFLTPQTPVLVRMETLRRASIYAARDSQVAFELLSWVMARALNAEAQGRAEALAWFDAGYLIESYRQTGWLRRELAAESRASGARLDDRDFFKGMEGYTWVAKALRLAGENADMEFAASLMTGGSWPNAHFRKALAEAKDGSLLGKNLLLHWGDSRTKSLAELRTKFASSSR